MISLLLGVLTSLLSFSIVLFNDNKLIYMENWWNGTNRGKPKYSEKNQCKFLFLYGKILTDWPGIETVFPLRETGN